MQELRHTPDRNGFNVKTEGEKLKSQSLLRQLCMVALASLIAMPYVYAQAKGDNPILAVLKEKDAELARKAQASQTPKRAAQPSDAKQATPPAPEAKQATAPAAMPATRLIDQRELKEGAAIYGIEGKLALELLKRLNLAGSESSVIAYNLRPNKSEKGVWNLTIKVTDGKNIVLSYFVKMDSKANVLEERGIVTEYVDAPRTGMEKITGIIKKPPKVPKKKVEKLNVTIENQPIIGKSKVVRVQRDNGAVSELMVSPDDIVTTLAQIVVWMGTVGNVPPEGISLRWTADGKPFPVILKQKIVDGKKIFSLYRNDPTQKTSLKDRPIVEFVVAQNEKQFVYPEKIVLDINGLTMEIVRKTQGAQK